METKTEAPITSTEVDKKQKAFEWVSKIIASCENEFHYESAERMIDLFHEKFGEEEVNTELGELTLQQQLMFKMKNVVL